MTGENHIESSISSEVSLHSTVITMTHHSDPRNLEDLKVIRDQIFRLVLHISASH